MLLLVSIIQRASSGLMQVTQVRVEAPMLPGLTQSVAPKEFWVRMRGDLVIYTGARCTCWSYVFQSAGGGQGASIE